MTDRNSQKDLGSALNDPFFNVPEEKNFEKKQRTEYHSIDEGVNKFRIYPAHPNSKTGRFSQEKTVSWLTVTVDEFNEGKPTGNKIKKRKPIFASTTHLGTKKDLVNEYVGFAKNKAIPNITDNEDEQKKIFRIVTGMKGVKPKTSQVLYADKYTNEGRELKAVEFNVSIQKDMREIALEMMSTQNAVSINPFTDKDRGIAVKITKDSVAGKKDPRDYYKTKLDVQQVDQFTTKATPTPLSEEDINNLSKLRPLDDIYVDVYKLSDWEYQWEGIQNFDAYMAEQGFPINVCEHEEFLQIAHEIKGEIDERLKELSAQGVKVDNHAPSVPDQVIDSSKIANSGVITEKIAQPEQQLNGNNGGQNDYSPVPEQQNVPQDDNAAKLAALKAKLA